MPRITYDQPQQVSPGLAITDLAGGLLGGYLQGTLQNEQADRAAQDAALGNPYERRRRMLSLAALPPEIRDSPNAQTYRQMIMSGGSLDSVLRAHRELDTDPVYGDTRVRKAREQDVQTAVASKLIDPGDAASAEAIRRGELTLGKLTQDAMVRNRTLADKKAEKDEKAAAGRETAAALGLPPQVPMADGAAGPGRLADYGVMGPEGVRAVAADRRAQADDERMAARDASTAQERAVDNAAQAAYRALQLDNAARDDQRAEKSLAETIRHNRAMEGKGKPVLSPEQAAAKDAQEAAVKRYERLLDQSLTNPKTKKVLDSQGLTQEILTARLAKLRKSLATPQTPGGAAAIDVSTMSDEDLLRVLAGS